MTQVIGTIMPKLAPLILAQSQVETAATTAGSWIDSLLGAIGLNLGTALPKILGAILILIIGWIVATIVRSVIRGLLNATSIDNKIADWISGGQGGDSLPIEKWISDIFFWVIILFTVVGVLQSLNLTAVSEPLNQLLGQVTTFIPKLGGAAILLGATWVLATLAKMLVTRVLGAFRLDERLNQQVGDSSGTSQLGLSSTLGNAVYWLVFLLFLPAILGILGLQGTLAPVQGLLDEILSALPNILKAVLIGAVGWFIAQLVRRVVTNLLGATGVDGVGAKFGLSSTSGTQSLSWILGTIAYVLVLIPTVISALEALQIEAISLPAIAMLQQVLDLLPKIFAAAGVMILAYMAGKYVSELVTNILKGVGFDNIFEIGSALLL